MPHAPGGNGDTIIVDPNQVHGVGHQIASSATNQLYNDPGSAFDLDNHFNNVKPQMPQVVQDALTTFQQTFHAAYSDLLVKRGEIGDLLSDAATQMEITDFKNAQRFDPTLEPTRHDFYTK